MKPLDFLIIGAQKCATTTLFEHLRAHPDIAMPLEKEVPFFTGAGCTPQSWAQFARRHFDGIPGKLRGKATPQYMCDPSAARNIHRLMPGIKLVAILRDPIERTWSHYQMGRRRATEERDFERAVSELLDSRQLAKARTLPVPSHREGYESEAEFYVAWSEYGRVLETYTRLFSPDQLLVIYTEDLQTDPQGTLDRVLAFIGLEPGFRPPALGEVMHQGGGSNKVPHGLRVWLRQRRWLYRLWNLLPEDRQGALRFRYEQWNVKKQRTTVEQIPRGARAALTSHYANDLARLMTLPVAAPPWLGRYGVSGAHHGESVAKCD
jgi:hypothetical protein